MRQIKTWCAASLIFVLAGCQTAGPNSIERGRVDYNNAIHDTSAQMMLANIVRVHLGEMPLVMDVTQVNAGLTVQASVSPSISGIGGLAALQGAGLARTTGSTVDAATGKTTATTGALATRVIGSEAGAISSSFQYQETPTVTYTPLSGQALISQLAAPMPVSTITTLSNQDWPLTSILTFGLNFLSPNSEDNYPILGILGELSSYRGVQIASMDLDVDDGTSMGAGGQTTPAKGQPVTSAQASGDASRLSFVRPTATNRPRPLATTLSKSSSSGEHDNILALYLTPVRPYIPTSLQSDDVDPARATYLVRRRILDLWVELLTLYEPVVALHLAPAYLLTAPPAADAAQTADPANTSVELVAAVQACERQDDAASASTGCVDVLLASVPTEILLHLDPYSFWNTHSVVHSSLGDNAPIFATNSALGALKEATDLSDVDQVAFVTADDYRVIQCQRTLWLSQKLRSDGLEEFYSFDSQSLSTATCTSDKPLSGFASMYLSDQLRSLGGGAEVFRPWTPAAEAQEHRAFRNRHFILVVKTALPPLLAISDHPVYVSFYRRGVWYSVMDDDKVSKKNFALLSLMMSAMAIPAQTAPPTPTLSVGH